MNNFNWETFTKKIAIKASISELYNAWTIPEEIEKWFLSNANFLKQNGEQVSVNKSIKTNDSYQWSWFLYVIVETGHIIEANGKDVLKFTFAGNCIVEITLEQHQEFVIVKLIQSNIPTDNESKRGIRLGCDSGWSFFLVNLKSVYEGGIDLRNKNKDLTGMLNN